MAFGIILAVAGVVFVASLVSTARRSARRNRYANGYGGRSARSYGSGSSSRSYSSRSSGATIANARAAWAGLRKLGNPEAIQMNHRGTETRRPTRKL